MDEAAASYRHALALDPGLAEAHHNLGTVLLESGHVEESLEHYRSRDRGEARLRRCPWNAGDALMQLERARRRS